MPPRLIKLTISKQTLAPRRAVMAYLDSIGRLDALPPQRCHADARRMAQTYDRRYRSEEEWFQAFLEREGQVAFGREHLFDLDLRRLAQTMLADDTEPLWHGVLVALTHAPVLNPVRKLSTLVTAGSITLDVLTLQGGRKNDTVIATALGPHYVEEVRVLTARLSGPRAKSAEVEAAYRKLCLRIRRAEEALGVQVLPEVQAQAGLEAALAQVKQN